VGRPEGRRQLAPLRDVGSEMGGPPSELSSYGGLEETNKAEDYRKKRPASEKVKKGLGQAGHFKDYTYGKKSVGGRYPRGGTNVRLGKKRRRSPLRTA